MNLAELPAKESPQRLHKDSTTPRGLHMESRETLWGRVKSSTFAWFIKHLKIEGVEEREWIIMGIINIASIMDYGRPAGVLRKVGCVGLKEVGGHGPQAPNTIAMRVPGSSTIFKEFS